MTKRKKTTFEERKEIVQYCIGRQKDYKGTALKYDCSYSQVYQWVRNYEAMGESGLNDNRGKRRKEEELTDLEKAQRRIRQLEHELLLKERENELLKKWTNSRGLAAGLPKAKRIAENKARKNIELDLKTKQIESSTNQTEVAKKVGLSLAYVNRITKGREQIVNKTFVKMIDELGHDAELTYKEKEAD